MQKLISFVKRHKEFLFCSLLMLWVGIAFFFMQTITFESNDDNSMARMAYGMIGEYETHLVFINIFVGQCLKAFLLLFPNVPWYTVFQCTLVFLSFFAICYLFLRKFGIRKGMFPCFLLVFFFGPQYFSLLQFTKTAGICSLAGLLLLFDAVKENATGKVWKFIFGGGLAIAGSLYRFNVFGMILIPLFGLGLTYIWEPLKAKDWKALLRICLPFVIVIGLCFAFKYYDKWAYQISPEWSAYREFNSLRAKLMDYGFPDYNANIALYESLGISAEDLAMFQNWDFADSEIFTTEALRQLVAAKPQAIISKRECLQTIIDFFFRYKYSFALLIAMSVAMATLKKDRSFFLVYAVVAIIGIQAYLFYKGRYGVNRVDVSITCTLFTVLLLHACSKFTASPRWISLLLAGLLFIAPFSESGIIMSGLTKTEDEPITFYELLDSDKEHLYVRTVTTSIPRIPRPLEIYPVGYQSNMVTLGGWGTNTGTYLNVWKHYGVTNLFRDLVDNPNLYFVATKALSSRLEYIRRHYAPDAQAYLVKVSEDGYPIYRIATTPHPTVDLSQTLLANGNESAHYGYALTKGENGYTFHGHFYVDGANSFASNIYFSLTPPAGKEAMYYTSQYFTNAFGDLNHGQYGAFSVELPSNYSPKDFITLYLECDLGTYCLYVGTVGTILQASGG